MAGQRVDLQAAAEMLGITSDAVRKRAKRGNLDYETGADGKLYVLVDDGRTGADAGDDQGVDHGYRGRDDRGELVEELRARVRYLEEESRRKDHLLAAALERIPAIEAPGDEPQGAETARETAEGAEDPEPVREPQTTARRPWWLRIFGG